MNCIGLKGEQIPVGARICAVADALDTITCDQPYRAARRVQVSPEEIESLSGKQFDPTVVQAFREVPDKVWEDLGKEAA